MITAMDRFDDALARLRHVDVVEPKPLEAGQLWMLDGGRAFVEILAVDHDEATAIVTDWDGHIQHCDEQTLRELWTCMGQVIQLDWNRRR